MLSFPLIVLLFFLPFFVGPLGISFFETPKVIGAEIIIEFLCALFVWKKQNFKKLFSFHLIPFYLLFAFSFFQLFLFQNENAFFGNVFRLQGIFLFWHLIVFAIISSQITSFKISPLIPITSLTLLFFSVFIFGQNQAGRFVGTIGEPNSLAAIPLFLLPWIWLEKNKPKHHVLIIILSSIFVFVILYLSGSKAALIGFIIQILFLLLLKFRISVNISTTLCVLLLGLSLLLPFMEEKKVYENRAEIWETALDAGLRNPLVGYGIGGIESALQQSALKMSNNLRFQYVDSAHNIFLDFWIQGGLLGLILFMWILFKSFYTFIHYKCIKELLILFGLLSILSFNPVSIIILIEMWWLLGTGFGKTTAAHELPQNPL